MVKDLGDAGEEVNVDVLFLEDAIDIAPVAIQFFCQPVDSAGLRHLIKNYSDPLSDFHVFGFSHTRRTPPRSS